LGVLFKQLINNAKARLFVYLFICRHSSCLYRASMTIRIIYYPTDAQIYNLRIIYLCICCIINCFTDAVIRRASLFLPIGTGLVPFGVQKHKIEICTVIILPVFFYYGCETWSVTVREGHRVYRLKMVLDRDSEVDVQN